MECALWKGGGIVLGPGALRIPLRDCARPGGCAFPGRSPRGPCNLEWHPGPAARWCFFAERVLREQALDAPFNKKAPQLRCDAILGCGE